MATGPQVGASIESGGQHAFLSWGCALHLASVVCATQLLCGHFFQIPLLGMFLVEMMRYLGQLPCNNQVCAYTELMFCNLHRWHWCIVYGL